MARLFFTSLVILVAGLMLLDPQAKAQNSEIISKECMQKAEAAVFYEFDQLKSDESIQRVMTRLLSVDRKIGEAKIYIHLNTFDIEGNRGSHHFVVTEKLNSNQCVVIGVDK